MAESPEHQEKKELKGKDKMVPWRHRTWEDKLDLTLFLEMMMLSQCLTMITQGGPGVGTRVQPSYLEPPLLPLLEKGSSRTLGSCFTKSQHFLSIPGLQEELLLLLSRFSRVQLCVTP